jgi:Rho guanine nucleotide exchange factor 10
MLFILFSEPEKGRVLGRIPLDSPAACLAFKAAKVWVGSTTDGHITAFTRGSTAVLPEYHIAARVATIKLGAGCVSAMVAAAADSGAALYAACGLRVSVLDVDSMEVVRNFTVMLPPPPQLSAAEDSAVSHLALAGSGLIAAVSSRPLLLLYHTETLVLVQHMDIAHSLLPATAATTTKNHNNGRETATATAVRITALTAGPRDVLWIGTSLGLVLTLPLPRMSCGLPLLSAGTGHVSRHAHRGPVRFVVEVPPQAADSAKRGRGGGRGVGGGGGGEGQPRIPCLMVAPPPQSPPVESEQQGPMTSSSPAAAEEPTTVKMSLKSGGGTPRMRIQRKSHDNHQHHHNNSVAERRASKTLPRGFSLSGYRAAATTTNDDYDDDEAAPTTAESMLQLYGELVNVRGDYADCSSGIGPPDFSGRKNGGGDAHEGDNGGGNLHQQRHSSDPDLAAIPYRVSTLDRRISMKLTRARSLDLSSWSLGSRTSSWTTSSSSGMHTHLAA